MNTRVAVASQLAGNKLKSAKELDELFQSCGPSEMLVGPVHGDLHVGNVFVRSADAIVIDFAQFNARSPLLSEAASLEASLLVSGFDDAHWSSGAAENETPDQRNARMFSATKEWMKALEPLYDQDPFDGLHAHPEASNPTCWFHDCVRQIRAYARHMQLMPNQYALCLAQALMVKATKDLDANEPESLRRATAYVFAERIVTSTLKAPNGKGEL